MLQADQRLLLQIVWTKRVDILVNRSDSCKHKFNLKALIFEFQNTWLIIMKYKEKPFEDSVSYSNVIKKNQHTDKILK